jgi:DNA (cytosine-5)-methyltransferase 1
MKILNLYAGIGGNRKLWGDEHEITAVEYDVDIAAAYKERFLADNIIVDDAVNYLLKNYMNYDFIWASPPCQSHSTIVNSQYTRDSYIAKLPDMTLYQLILFLQGHGRQTKWVVENVIPYYEPLIKPDAEVGRHLYWSNFKIQPFETTKKYIIKYVTIETLKDFDISKFDIKNKRQVIRNQVDPDIGFHILNCAMNIQEPLNYGLFDETN